MFGKFWKVRRGSSECSHTPVESGVSIRIALTLRRIKSAHALVIARITLRSAERGHGSAAHVRPIPRQYAFHWIGSVCGTGGVCDLHAQKDRSQDNGQSNFSTS